MPTPIAVLDFGGQYAHLIANRIRRLHAYSEIFPNTVSPQELEEKNIQGIILSGGPHSVYEDGAPQINPKILEMDIPILGICYGHQLIAQILGGSVKPGTTKEYGKSAFSIAKQSTLLKNFPDSAVMWMSHGDSVKTLPEGFEIIGTTADCPVAAMSHEEKRIYGVQFHPEVTHSEKGMLVLENFIRNCGVENSWQMDDFLASEIEKIQAQATGKNVFLLVSGGVDSSVTFALLEKALGKDRVYGLFVDHGLLRKNEAEEVKAMLASAGFTNLHVAHEEERFLKNLEGVTDPEEKRKIIGNTFLDVQAEVTQKLNLDPEKWLLGQGTIYPDTIESGGTKHAAKIKTHHNRVEKIQKLIDEGKIIEPVKDLYKDEVREVGRKLGLPEKMVARHPFPGPGLGVRILCAEKADVLDNAQEIEKNIEEKFPQITATILPIKSVGVQGDFRSYRHPVAIGMKESLDWDQLDDIASAIPNLFPEINRVVINVVDDLCVVPDTDLYVAPNAEKISPNPSFKKRGTSPFAKGGFEGDFQNDSRSTIHDPRFMTKDRITILQEADAIIRNILETEDFEGKENIWQFPVVLCPVETQHAESLRESIILRPVESQEAMTASFARIPFEIVQKMSDEIMQKLAGKISAVFYDVTNKPPGTIEWE